MKSIEVLSTEKILKSLVFEPKNLSYYKAIFHDSLDKISINANAITDMGKENNINI